MPQDANRPLVFGSQLIGVVVVILTLLTRQVELRSTRPIGDKKQIAAQPDRNGDYFARLWDDPLSRLPTFEVATQQPQAPPEGGGTSEASDETAAPPATEQSTEAPPPPTALPATQQSQKVLPPPPQSIAEKGIFIWNVLDARPLPEIKERRLRIRYAVVSALLAKGYLPINESLLIPLGTPPIAYYETFRLKTNATENPDPFQSVTLIWIPKQSTALKSMFDQKTRDTMQKQIADEARVPAGGSVRFLHHGSSEDFDAYLAAKDLPDKNVSFMRATIPVRYLQNQDATRAKNLRGIMGDETLVPSLVGELCLRIPSLNGRSNSNRPRVLLLTESDTSYSRAIASEVTRTLDPLARIEVYSYLRGLDGRPEDAPKRSKSDDGRSNNDVAAALLRGKAISEASVGTSQFDYLRRLSLSLEQAKKDKSAGQICAVGILGTDIYDKMLVLQAIRPQLPAAIFFTTDLDALYLERDNESFTRNLVVASADNLDANPAADETSASWKLPPMRDSYQTVLVKHLWQILKGGPEESQLPTSEKARVFEIVAGKSIELAPVDAADFWGKRILGLLPKLGNILIFVLALGNAFLILRAISTRTVEEGRPDCAPMSDLARKFVYTEIALALLALVAMLVVFVCPLARLGEEPLNLEASVWPSITIRLLAFVVAIRLLMIASNAFVVHVAGIDEKLGAAVPKKTKLPLAEGLVKQLVRDCVALWSERPQSHRDKTFEDVLAKNFDHDARQKRIKIASLVYLAISFLLFYWWPPAVPARGAVAFLVEKVILALGVGLYIIHLMYCLDLHVSACTLLRTLRSFYSPEVAAREPGLKIDPNTLLRPASELTSIIGKTLLYPLTILILIIISRLTIFDNWTMTPSLSVTFLLGAAMLVLASMILWREGALLKQAVINHEQQKILEADPEKEGIESMSEGVFAPWHRQPIFAAIFSSVAVFGSLTVAEPLVRLIFGSA